MQFVGDPIRPEALLLDVLLHQVVHRLDEELVLMVQQLTFVDLVGTLRRIEIIFHLLLVAHEAIDHRTQHLR